MSDNVESVTDMSVDVENVGVAVEMVPISVAFQKLFLLPVYSPPL